MPKKDIIAVDIDEVLYPFLKEFVADHNLKFKTNLKVENFSTYEFEDSLGINRRKSIQRIYDFSSKTDQINPEPIKDSKDAILKIAKFYDLVIITSRHPQYRDITVKWLNRHFKNVFKSVHLIGYHKIIQNPVYKSDICLAIGAKHIIDDSLDNILDCAKKGINGILFGDYPWNQGNLNKFKNITRLKKWTDVLNYFGIN